MKRAGSFERFTVMACLVAGGEAIYTLPYFLRRDYANSLTGALGVSQTELGTLSALFGIVAMLSYFPGGWLADRIPTRLLFTGSLLATAVGGFAFAALPGYPGALAVFGFWGISTILTFWAALIKAARMWGGARQQGRAFGILDGGRALLGAVFGTVALALFDLFATERAGLRAVIMFYSCLNVAVAAAAWWRLPVQDEQVERAPGVTSLGLLRLPAVWLHAAVIFCAYSAYWGTYNLAGFAADGYGLGASKAAGVSVFGTWFGPPAAIGAGFLVERFGAGRVVMLSLLIMAAALALLAAVPPVSATVGLLWVNAAMACGAAFALRGTYYALLEDGGIPTALTGSAVGFVSVVGYSPDIFIPTLTGLLVDGFEGGTGYRILFGVLAGLCIVGAWSARNVVRWARA